MAEVVYEVLNIKNTTVGFWPFKVAMQDIDIVREAWGYPVQLAHIKRGVCEANSIVYDKDFEIFVLTSQLFKLYRSHTMSDESSDRPTLKLGKVGSVIWLVRRYFHKFAIWLVVLISFTFGAKNFIEQIPTMMTNAIKPPNFQLPDGAKQPSSPPAVNPQVPASLSAAEHVPERSSARTDDIIMGFVKGGVITQRGVIRQEEHLTVDGEKDYVKNVDVFRGILYLGSGKKIQK